MIDVAGGRSTRSRPGQGGYVSHEPVYETDDPDNHPHGSSFILQTIMELQKSHGALTQSVADLAKMIDQKMQKLDKIEDIRVEIKGLSTTLQTTCNQLSEVKAKTDKVHTWVVGAAAVISAVVVAATVGSRFIPTTPASHPNYQPQLVSPAIPNSTPDKK